MLSYLDDLLAETESDWNRCKRIPRQRIGDVLHCNDVQMSAVGSQGHMIHSLAVGIDNSTNLRLARGLTRRGSYPLTFSDIA